MKLNDKQELAVNTKSKIIRVVAGAGSGKTRVLTERIKRLLDNGVPAEAILAITFTNKAAKEMKERVGDNDVNISTIHSLCVKILRNDYKIKGFQIIDGDDQQEIIKQILEDLFINNNFIKPRDALNITLKTKLRRLDKNFEIPDDKPWCEIYTGYVDKLKSMNAMDFDDLIINTVEMFRDDNIAKRWASQYKYVLVDEFQDVDILQYELIKKLSSYYGNLFVVGDGDQMIYSWRGSEETIFNNFDKDFSECETIILNQNYRSTKNILDSANELIQHNEERIPKDLYTEAEDGENIQFNNFMDEYEEAEFIANKIRSYKISGGKYSDNAILYRANYMSKAIEGKLRMLNIPYVTYGAYKFYDRKEVKDMLAYLKLIEYGDDLSLKRVINVPSRKIGKMKIMQIEDLAIKNSKTMLQVLLDGEFKSIETDSFIKLYKEMKNLPYWEILDYLVKETGYLSTLETEDKVENAQEIINDIIFFHNEHKNAVLNDYLSEVTLYTDKIDDKEGDVVKLMTIHTSKGLEFENVYVISMTEGKFPKDNNNFTEEERRLAYVAITRAKKNLNLCTEKRNFNGRTRPSIFFYEAMIN